MTDRKARLKEVLKKVAMQHKDVYKSRSALARKYIDEIAMHRIWSKL